MSSTDATEGMAEVARPRVETVTENGVREHRIEIAENPVTSLNLLAHTAELWGAGWQAESRHGGKLVLPVTAGVRRGWIGGRVEVEARGAGSLLKFRVEESDYRVEKTTVLTLLMAAAGAAVTVFAPFFPRLIALMPAGILLTLAAWLFIVARLRNSGPEEFFEDVAAEAGS